MLSETGTEDTDSYIINGQMKNKTTPNTVTAFCCPQSKIKDQYSHLPALRFCVNPKTHKLTLLFLFS